MNEICLIYIYIYILVASGVDLNEDIPSVVVGDGIDGVLNGPVVATAVNVNRDFTVTDGSDPLVVVGGVGGRECLEGTVVVCCRRHCCCMEYTGEEDQEHY